MFGLVAVVSYLGVKTWQTLYELVSEEPVGCA